MDCRNQPSSSGQSAFPNRLDYTRQRIHHENSSGQSAFPNRLDFLNQLYDGSVSSGQSAFPNRLDSQCNKLLLINDFSMVSLLKSADLSK